MLNPMLLRGAPRTNSWLLLGVLLAATALVYYHGFPGDFVFDDSPNILTNDHLQIERLDLTSLRAAALSGDAGPLKRPLSMLSFALNYYATGFDPLYFKVTNLAVHLLNGISLYVFISLIVGVRARREGDTATPGQREYLALAVTAAWLLHPLAVTSVLYVVQRMNSLAVLFTLWGLISYVRGRQRLDEHRNSQGLALMAVGVVGFGALASLCKENGALLPLYALVLEASLFRFRTATPVGRNGIYALFAVAVALPLLVAALYIAFHPDWLLSQYRIRTFTLTERLLTESRILWLYLKWIVMPNNAELGLFHDDITVSTGLFQPLTTVFSCIGLILLLGGAVALRKRAPLVTFGLLWFLAGHGLESSFLGLELAHEHRNYLPMVGILLIIFFALFSATKSEKLNRLRLAATIMAILLLGTVTALRAAYWGSNVTLNLVEAEHHPDSVRATYQAGRQYTALYERDRTRRDLYDKAWYYLTRSTQLDTTSTVGFFGLIYLYEADHRKAEPVLIAELGRRLRTSFFGSYELLSLKKLAATEDQRAPSISHDDILALFDAALDNPTLQPGVRAMLLSTLSGYYANQRHAYPDAIALAAKAIEVAPNDAIFNVSFAGLLLALQQPDAARDQLRIAREKDRLGRFSRDISSMEARLTHHD